MEDDKILLKELMVQKLFDKWVIIINKNLINLVQNNPYKEKIDILYEPDIPSINFDFLFSQVIGCNQISIEHYIKSKLRHHNLLYHIPKLEYRKDPIGLGYDIYYLCLIKSEYNEFERMVHSEWELIVTSGKIEEKVYEYIFRKLKVSCIIHVDRNDKSIVRHENIFYDRINDQLSIYEWMVFKLKSLQLSYLHPYIDYINDPNGLKTKVFVFGITRDKKALSPRFFQSIKSSK